jgi:iron(III) transport system ATP-binding protein
MAVSIRLDKLTKVFGSTRAVDGIDLTIEPGELFFLLGPSGCGKTTLLRCIAGFNIPDSGTLHIGDRDVTATPPHERDTGMVFQSYALWPHLSVRENVSFGLEMRNIGRDEARRRVEEALAAVRMTERADYKPTQLSGGQQQRVALARALVIRPQALLLDEPLSNLDAKLRLDMRAEIRRICKAAGTTAIYVTHDQKEALSIADRMAILEGGKIRQLGTPQEVYLRPNSKFVANFMGETNFLDATVVSTVGTSCVVDAPLGRVTCASLPAGGVQLGQKVTLSLRPEVLRLGDSPAGCPNQFEVSVSHTLYLGEMAQHTVSTGPAELKAFEMNPRIVARDGATVSARLWIQPEDAVVLNG